MLSKALCSELEENKAIDQMNRLLNGPQYLGYNVGKSPSAEVGECLPPGISLNRLAAQGVFPTFCSKVNLPFRELEVREGKFTWGKLSPMGY